MKSFLPFAIEKYMSAHEREVEYNLSESGVYPLKLAELLTFAGDNAGEMLNEIHLDYPEVNGLRRLRERIASFYPGAGPENVLVTVGASEANLLAATTLLHPGDEIAVFQPSYLQFSGIARNMGISMTTLELNEENNWKLDVQVLRERVGPNTRVIALVNPNNPTGSTLDEATISELINAARRHDAWILADEVYAGTEHHRDEITPTLYGRYERVIAINSMSKAYGLPGLRLGWLVAPEPLVAALWRRHEYAVISTDALSQHLADLALSENVRPRLLQRTRRLIRSGYEVLSQRLAVHDGVFHLNHPDASAVSFPRVELPIGTEELCRRLRNEKKLLLIPGECFGRENHLRISSALPIPYLTESLSRLNEVIETLI